MLRKPECETEVYNDLDGDLVNLFRVIRERGAELAALLDLTPYARDTHDLKTYYAGLGFSHEGRLLLAKRLSGDRREGK